MKLLKWSAVVLISGLFIASCGSAENKETTEDTTYVPVGDASEAPAVEEAPAAMPDTVNGIDTTVNVKEKPGRGVGPADAKVGG